MSKPNPGSSMLIDIQYVKPNRYTGAKDYLYIIWRDLINNNKYMEAVPEPRINIYFEKKEFRNHSYNKNYCPLSELDTVAVKYKDIIYAIAEDMGEQGKALINNAFATKNFKQLEMLHLYPYVFGADFDPVAWYRIQWLRSFDNDLPKKLHKGFLDIEVDGIDVPGMPSPEDCPINAITLIDEFNKDVYTFLLTDREYIEKDTSHMNEMQKKTEQKRRQMYSDMHNQQYTLQKTNDKFVNKLHEMFDESYGDLDYNIYYYNDERKMLVHLFQLINTLKLDFIGIWNMAFDIPYIIRRLEVLGLDPADVMCHPDFPVKECRFKEDTRHHEIKNKCDSFILSSYTIFYCQMELYAAIRKGGSELRSYRLNIIANKELKDSKLDYSEDGDIKTLPYTNFEKFVIYNIKDVLLQMGIERRTTDFDTLYVSSYENATPYDKVFKQTVLLRNVQYLSFLSQDLIPGANVNIYNDDKKPEIEETDEDADDTDFEGALVADPVYNDYIGVELYGRPTNNIFLNGVDFDMSAFYPNSIIGANIDPSTLIFKVIMDIDQYDICGGEIHFRGITGNEFNTGDDASKECIDNFQTGNYLTTASKWFNLPDISEVYARIKNKD